MIFIKKPAAPTWMLDKDSVWSKETGEAIEWYEAGNDKSFEFKAYSDGRLKDELKKVFVKCAYCEGIYGAVYDGDIEHFRPKGKIKEKNPSTPGYYWLANDWDNLLLSCQHCNQRRQHVLYGEEKISSAGKLDQFPLADEQYRCTYKNRGDFAGEEHQRLLLQPCIDKPEEHLAYEKEEGVVFGTTTKGKKSIEVYALQRPFLVQERKKVLMSLFKQLKRTKRALTDYNEDLSPETKQIFDEEFDDLKAYGDNERPYAGLCRFFIKDFLNENKLGEYKLD